jgi:hypothetical protein
VNGLLFASKMTFSRKNLSDELHQMDINPFNPDYKNELTKLVIQKFGFSAIGDLNQDQLDEVNVFSKQFHCYIRKRWKKYCRKYDVMVHSSPCFFNEIVSFKTIASASTSKGLTCLILWLTILCSSVINRFFKLFEYSVKNY